MDLGGLTLRAARDDDAKGLIALIGGVFDEYPGCVMDEEADLPDLLAVATIFARKGGRFWVVEREGIVVACIGMAPSDPGEPGEGKPAGGVELKRLYIHKSERRRGLGSRLCDLVEGEARALGAPFVDLWSDTRFHQAHALYERRGYVRGPATRDLHDKSNSTEYYYRLDFKPRPATP